jgi:hypothetical protein
MVWISLVRGFERSAAIFMGSLMLSIPSTVGGAIAGWMQSQPVSESHNVPE